MSVSCRVLVGLLLGLVLATACTRPTPAAPTTSPVASAPTAVPEGALDPELTTYTYPFEVRFFEHTAQRQRVRMAYMDVQAEQPNGRTVLLLHGKNFSGAQWEPVIRALVAAGYRVVAPDQIGFGKSTKPEAFQFTFQQLAHSTRALLDDLGIDRVSVVGHSMGGMLATRFVLMFPNRSERLALLNPIGLEDWKTVVPARTVDEWYAAELESTPETIRAYQRDAYYGGTWKPAYDALMAPQAGWTLHPEYPRIAWVSALTYDMIFTQPVVYEFPRIAVPTLLVIGQRDRTAIGKAWAPKAVAPTLGNYPALGKAAAAAIPGATLVELEGVGHLPQIEAFERTRDALLAHLR